MTKGALLITVLSPQVPWVPIFFRFYQGFRSLSLTSPLPNSLPPTPWASIIKGAGLQQILGGDIGNELRVRVVEIGRQVVFGDEGVAFGQGHGMAVVCGGESSSSVLFRNMDIIYKFG